MVKLENVKPFDFGVNFPMANGHVKSYNWKPARVDRRSVVEVDNEVYEWLRFETKTFQMGYLILAAEEKNEQIIEEMIEISEETAKVFSLEQIKQLLNGSATALKKELTKETSRDIVLDFVEVAKAIKLDKDTTKNYLAELLGCKDNRELVFPVE